MHRDKLRISTSGRKIMKFLENGEVKKTESYEASIYGQQLMFADKQRWMEGGENRTIDY